MARKDILLPVCYRNTPWVLTVAHGVGLGVHRPGGLVQFFEDPAILEEVGYEVVTGELRHGEKVAIERKPTSYPTGYTSRDCSIKPT